MVNFRLFGKCLPVVPLISMVKARKYVFAKQFDGLPKATDLQLVEEELPPIKNGEFLVEAIYLSVDPYMRAYAPNLTIGTTYIGSQVAKVLESKNPKYPVGAYVAGELGWRTHTISNGDESLDALGFPKIWKVPDPEGLPLSLFVGVLGMPGNTAYFGFLEVCKPQPGETVVVSGAAGAVGSLVGQIAKIKGCTVVGITGSDAKGKWLVNELNFDRYVNYKDADFDEQLIKATPKGVDCYFDNVGGEISVKVLNQMNEFGRAALCGAISGYNGKPPKVDAFFFTVVVKQLKIEGLIFNRWMDQWYEGIEQNKKWIKEGKLKYRETVTEGFENMVEAFVDMLKGGNFGKAVVKI